MKIYRVQLPMYAQRKFWLHQSSFHSSETMAPTANRRPNRDMWVTTGGAPDSAACSGQK